MLTSIGTTKGLVNVCVRNRERGDAQTSQWDGRIVVVTGGQVIGHGSTVDKALIDAQINLDNWGAENASDADKAKHPLASK